MIVINTSDEVCLVSATRDGVPIPVWDREPGPLWFVWDSCGPFVEIIGVVRAKTWERAWDAAVDEIFPDPPEDELRAHAKEFASAEAAMLCLPEGWLVRGGFPAADPAKFPNLKTGYCRHSLDCPHVLSQASLEDAEKEKIDVEYESYSG